MVGITRLLIKFQVARKMQLVEGELYSTILVSFSLQSFAS